MRILILCVATFACGGDDDGAGGDAGMSRRDGAPMMMRRDSGPSGGPPVADCDSLEPVDVSGATEVADEGALRAAIEAGGNVRLTADITASAPFDVTQPTVLDGGGFTISGDGSTHLFTSNRTDFTIQNVTLADGNNQVPDSEHFSRRSGAAIMARGDSRRDAAPTRAVRRGMASGALL